MINILLKNHDECTQYESTQSKGQSTNYVEIILPNLLFFIHHGIAFTCTDAPFLLSSNGYYNRTVAEGQKMINCSIKKSLLCTYHESLFVLFFSAEEMKGVKITRRQREEIIIHNQRYIFDIQYETFCKTTIIYQISYFGQFCCCFVYRHNDGVFTSIIITLLQCYIPTIVNCFDHVNI